MAEQATSTTATPTPTAVVKSSSDKSLKRKLEDALQTLDEAVGPTSSPTTIASRPPLKRLRTSRSIYAMLAKYGIKKDSKQPTAGGDYDNLSKTAPHLAAILSRTATRTRKALPFRIGQHGKPISCTAPSSSDYRPSSMSSFLARLSTYRLTTYGNKPAAIDAVAASKCGWINDGKDRLTCGLCGVSWVLASRDGMTREAANVLVEKQRVQLVEAHKDGCPWKTRQCDDSIYRIPLQAPLATIRELKSRAILLDNVMRGVEIKHPLSASQVQSIIAIVSSVSVSPATAVGAPRSSTPTDESASTASIPYVEPIETSVLTALFGWSILPPLPAESSKFSLVSRAGSVVPATPSRSAIISRTPSAARDGTSTPSTTSSSFQISPSVSLLSQHSVTSGLIRPDVTLLHCPLCQRRVGLWAFLPKPVDEDDSMTGGSPSSLNGEAASKKVQPQRQLDILREHRPYCPYVVRSTVLPSLPPPSSTTSHQQRGHERSMSLASVSSANGSTTHVNAPSGAIEGWRAVMTVVSRYGNAQRQRLGMSRTPSVRVDGIAEGEEGIDEERNSIDAMVAGVKSHGGKDLLKYVRGLLG